jgi:hypothetical protein
MPKYLVSAALVAGTLLSALTVLPARPEASAPVVASRPGNVTASGPALALLKRARLSLGSGPALAGLESLTFDLTRTQAGGSPYRSTFRMLFPDRFQETAPSLTFTFDGPAFWQVPDRGEEVRTAARRNTVRQFTRYSLLLLLRATSQVPVNAAVGSVKTPGAAALRFTGPDEFETTIEFDPATARPLGMVHFVSVSQGGNPSGQAERRVVIDDRATVSGISFPVRMQETMGSMSSTLELSGIKCNAGVTPDDFRAR